jgi:aldehyde:ferredoxin oxidoreductase
LYKFLRGVFAGLYAEAADLLRHLTSWGVTAEELRATAKRMITQQKFYNIREGWTAAEGMLPDRFLGEGPATSGKDARLPAERLRVIVRAYYAARGWGDERRVPSEGEPAACGVGALPVDY